jgi:hypothetical protein
MKGVCVESGGRDDRAPTEELAAISEGRSVASALKHHRHYTQPPLSERGRLARHFRTKAPPKFVSGQWITPMRGVTIMRRECRELLMELISEAEYEP